MGTNFYFLSKNKPLVTKWFGTNYNLTDKPYFAYKIHIAKTSIGWIPLFQAYENISSIYELKKCYDSGYFQIVDEYGNYYNWEDFKERVIDFENGTDNILSRNHTADGLEVFRDSKGYEFTKLNFY